MAKAVREESSESSFEGRYNQFMIENITHALTNRIPLAILVGSILISFSILLSSGIIHIKGISPSGLTAAPQGTAPAPLDPNAPPAPPAKADASIGHLPIKGSDSAKVALIEFADMRCPFCKKFFDESEPQLLKEYVDTGKVKFAFRHYQFLGPASTLAGNAVECANEQGKFWESYDYLYKNQPDESDTSMYTSEKLTNVAGTLGLNTTQFKSCLDTTKYAKNVTDDQSEGQKAGVTATPSFIIGKLDASGKNVVGGQLVVGAQPYATLKAAIEQALAE